MKAFKNSFGVTGSPQQIEAFKEFAEGIGWSFQVVNKNGGYLSFTGDCDVIPNSFFRAVHLGGLIYQLPEQWSEAMEAASETVELETIIFKNYSFDKDGCTKRQGSFYETMEEAKLANVSDYTCIIKLTTIDGKTTAEIVHTY